MTRPIRSHKGGRTSRAPEARMTPQERSRLDEVLQRRGVKHTDWYIAHVEADYAEITQGDDTMKYTVEVKAKNGEPISVIPDLTETRAKRTAKQEAKDNPEALVFVSWYRSSDGQHGYLNPDGNHAITGNAW